MGPEKIRSVRMRVKEVIKVVRWVWRKEKRSSKKITPMLKKRE